MSLVLSERLRTLLVPPRYLNFPFSGIDISPSSVKAVRLAQSPHGLVLSGYAEIRLPAAIVTTEGVRDMRTLSTVLQTVAKRADISAAHVVLPSKTDEMLAVFDDAKIEVHSFEKEADAVARAILPWGEESTVLLIDIGKTTTRLSVVTNGTPCLDTLIANGGHAFTLAVQKHFGVTETEARGIKAEQGLQEENGNNEYQNAMRSVAARIATEITPHLRAWQEQAAHGGSIQSISQAFLVGGNASVRGLPEYFQKALYIPVERGDVFAHFASRDTWMPQLDVTESLSFATAIGLALRDHRYDYV